MTSESIAARVAQLSKAVELALLKTVLPDRCRDWESAAAYPSVKLLQYADHLAIFRAMYASEFGSDTEAGVQNAALTTTWNSITLFR